MRVKPGKINYIRRIGRKEQNSIPGPGAYESLKTISPDGRYFITKFHDSGSSALKSFANRFPEVKLCPGPGQYEHPRTITHEGRNFISRFRSCSTLSFGISERKFPLGGNKGIQIQELF
jgi:hypothetical protein